MEAMEVREALGLVVAAAVGVAEIPQAFPKKKPMEAMEAMEEARGVMVRWERTEAIENREIHQVPGEVKAVTGLALAVPSLSPILATLPEIVDDLALPSQVIAFLKTMRLNLAVIVPRR